MALTSVSAPALTPKKPVSEEPPRHSNYDGQGNGRTLLGRLGICLRRKASEGDDAPEAMKHESS
jgi:hypothetical protein